MPECSTIKAYNKFVFFGDYNTYYRSSDFTYFEIIRPSIPSPFRVIFIIIPSKTDDCQHQNK